MNLEALIPTVLGFLLTVSIFSYIWRDNLLFRLAIHLFIGVSAGYAGAIALRNVLLPKMVLPMVQAFLGGSLDVLILFLPPFLLGLALLAKVSTRLSWLGSPAMAYLVGVGAAAAIGGAILGTLFPQIEATTDLVDLESGILLVGTVSTLMYFHFGARAAGDESPERHQVIEYIGWGGQVFIAVTFGVLFAGVYTAALTALIERMNFLLNSLLLFF